ncbi:MAG: hypothetical protein ACI4GB_06135 [Acutalibacteraceae bacterium]
MKKELKVIIAIVVVIWAFVMGFELGIYKEKKNENANAAAIASSTTTTMPSTVTTTAPTTTAPTAPSSTVSSSPDASAPSADPSQSSTAPAAKDPSAMSKDEIIAEMTKAMNQLKNEQNMTANKNASVVVNVTSCSVQSAVSTINKVVKGITDKMAPSETFTFVNGQATNSEGATVTPRDVIPPTGKDFAITADGVASATATKQGENTEYTIVTVVEDTTIENPIPPYNSGVIGYLDVNSLGIPFNITKGDMHYPGSTITITVNPAGKVVKIVSSLPMTGEGAAKIMGMEGTATFEGGLNESWDFTY